MRDMRQVLQNRLFHPELYGAAGAKTIIDIIKAPGKFSGFEDYPNIDPNIANNIDEDVRYANNSAVPHHADYSRHVQNAMVAASESVTPSVSGFPDATAWRTKDHGSPGAGFRRLGTVEGNTFYGPAPQPKPKTPHGEGDDNHLKRMTPVEKARHLAKQARAAPKPVPKHMELHHLLTKHVSARQPYSFAPVPNKGGTKAVTPGQKAAGELSDPQELRALLRPHMEALQARRAAGSLAVGGVRHLASGTVGPHGVATHKDAGTSVEGQAARFQTGRAGLMSPAAMMRPQMPSIAPLGVAATQRFEDAIRDFFNRQARMPPSTGTAFDPTMTPQWSSFKTLA